MGRHKKPTKLKIIQGTYQPCRAPKNEIMDIPDIEDETPPKELNEDGAKDGTGFFLT